MKHKKDTGAGPSGAVMHGFVAHEEAGGFAYIGTPRDESYRIAIRCVIDGINKEEAGR